MEHRGQDARHDVLVVGGGLVGASLAIALEGAGIDVGLVDASPPGALPEVFDQRSLSFGEATVNALRALGVLQMEDEAGADAKLLAVPIDKVLPIYRHWVKATDLAPERRAQIQHFFEHYKDLEPGKWVKVLGWGGPEDAESEIMSGIERYDETTPKPMY